MSDQDRAQLAIEIGLIRSVLLTLISWLAQSSTGVISIEDARELLEKLESINVKCRDPKGDNEIQQLREQLASEQELRKRWERKTEEVFTQLAAAQAAIADASDLIEHADPASLSSPLRDKLTDILSSTDTSALDAATNPLVAALEAIKELSGPRSEAKRIAYTVLEHLKEGQ